MKIKTAALSILFFLATAIPVKATYNSPIPFQWSYPEQSTSHYLGFTNLGYPSGYGDGNMYLFVEKVNPGDGGAAGACVFSPESVSFYNGSSTFGNLSIPSLTAGDSVACYWDGSTIFAYINGSVVDSASFTPGIYGNYTEIYQDAPSVTFNTVFYSPPSAPTETPTPTPSPTAEPTPSPTAGPTPTAGGPTLTPTPQPNGKYIHQICVAPPHLPPISGVIDSSIGPYLIQAGSTTLNGVDLSYLRERTFTGIRIYVNNLHVSYNPGNQPFAMYVWKNYDIYQSSGEYLYFNSPTSCTGYLLKKDFSLPFTSLFDNSGSANFDLTMGLHTQAGSAPSGATWTANDATTCFTYEDLESTNSIEATPSVCNASPIPPPIGTCPVPADFGISNLNIGEWMGYYYCKSTNWFQTTALGLEDTFLTKTWPSFAGIFVPSGSDLTNLQTAANGVIDSIKAKAPLAYIYYPIYYVQTNVDFTIAPPYAPIIIPIGNPNDSQAHTNITLDLRPESDVQSFLDNTCKPVMRIIVDLAFLIIWWNYCTAFFGIKLPKGGGDDTGAYNEWQNTHRK